MRLGVPVGFAAAVVLAVGVALAAGDEGRSSCGAVGDRERTTSPGGRRSAFVRCTDAGSAWLYLAEGGRERRVVPASYGCCYRPSTAVVFREPAWAPDGRRLAVVIEDVGGVDVWVIDVERLSARRATAGPARESDPGWSTDGSRITFRTETGEAGATRVPHA